MQHFLKTSQFADLFSFRLETKTDEKKELLVLKKELTKNDLNHKSSFNTYLIHGLPKGPICNPGKESIIAVTNPSKGDLLYFVADGEGGHNFSSNYQKHIENVKKFKEFSMEKYGN